MATQIKPEINVENSTVTFNIADGGAPLVFDMTKAHPDLIRRAALVGFAQVRIVDAAAVERQDDDGNIRTAQEMLEIKRERMAALIAHIESGTAEWSRKGSGTGGGGKSLTIEAIAAIKGMEYDAAMEMIGRVAAAKGMERKAYLAKMREAPTVQAEMAAIRAKRRPAPKADADAMLDELK